MKIIIEKSIQELIQKELENIVLKWPIEEWKNAVLNPTIVENILSMPHRLVDYVTEDGKRWAIIMPTEPGTLFILDYSSHKKETASYCGGAIQGHIPRFNVDDLITVIVYGNEKSNILELRIVHELLHGLNLPSDDLHKYSYQAFKLPVRYLYSLLHKLGIAAEHIPFFQTRFYRWLLLSRKEGIM